MPEPLRQALAEHTLARRALLERYPELAEDDPAFLDTLDGCSGLKEAIIAVINSYEEDRVTTEAIEQRIKELEGRQARLEHRMKRKYEMARNAMDLAQQRTIVAPEFTLSLVKGVESVVVVEEHKIPDSFMRERVMRTPDLGRIKEMLVNGRSVPGTQLSNAPYRLQIRRT